MKFQTSDRKLWRESLNIESSFCFFVAKNEQNCAYAKNSQQSTCFCSDIPNSMTTQGSRCRYASCSEFYANIYTQSDTTEHMKICCSIVSPMIDKFARFSLLFCGLDLFPIFEWKFSKHGKQIYAEYLQRGNIQSSYIQCCQKIERNWGRVDLWSWKLFCSLRVFIGNERWVLHDCCAVVVRHDHAAITHARYKLAHRQILVFILES
jgi:hypothetical protein